MKNKISGVVIFYNPSDLHISYCFINLNKFSFLTIVVNGHDEKKYEILKKEKNIEMIFMNYNSGIAKASNVGIFNILNKNIYKYVVLLDQDTLLPSNYNDIMDVRDCLIDEKVKVGILAPVYKNPRTNINSKSLIFNKFFFKRIIPEGNYFISTCPIASGSLINIDLFNIAGFLNEDLFIDYVDVEFSLRLSALGYVNFVIPTVCMNHELGFQKVYNIFGFSFRPTNHSPLRKYYITRNRLYILKKYGFKFPSLFLYEFMAFNLDVLRIILFENNKFSKFKFIIFGLLDFIKGKYGPFE